MPLLEVASLRTSFHTRSGVATAVHDATFHVERGETLGIVGESGSGKSVLCLSLLDLLPRPPARIEARRAHFDGVDLLQGTAARSLRGRRIAMVFQDAMTALNPYLTIGEQLAEPLRIHENLERRASLRRAVAALEEVGIPDAAKRLSAYPHEFSGGMRQRVLIAMALITRPDLLIADEPTTALDVTVQAQILHLLRRLREDRGMSMLFITHDLGVVAGLCDRVQVMYAGRIVETAATEALFSRPRHPYTRDLLRAVPSLQQPGQPLFAIPGLPPDPAQPSEGCPFAPRCADAREACRATPPVLQSAAPSHATACTRVHQGEILP